MLLPKAALVGVSKSGASMYMTIRECVPIFASSVSSVLPTCVSQSWWSSPTTHRSEHTRKESGNEQMFGQAAAVLVALSTLATLQFTSAIRFLPVLHQVLTLAGTPDS